MKKTNLFIALILLALVIPCCTNTDNQLELEEENINAPIIHDSIIPDSPIMSDTNSFNLRKYIYLTIDDAPLNGSEYIDSIILGSKTKTSLFVVGKTIDESGKFRKYYEEFKKNPYIEIDNHSYSHAHHKYVDYYKKPELVLEDFEKNRTEFNMSNKIARLPGRNLWNIGDKKKNCNQTGAEAATLLKENGYNIVGWDIEWKYNPKDYTPEQSIDELVKEIENMVSQHKTFTPNHIILLTHNQMFTKINDKNNLAELITKLKENGYDFEYISLYPDLKG